MKRNSFYTDTEDGRCIYERNFAKGSNLIRAVRIDVFSVSDLIVHENTSRSYDVEECTGAATAI